MAAKVRRPARAKASRAGKDMHNPNRKVGREAAEVLAIIPRKPRGKKS
jgi:hypothetical protein